MGTEATTGSTRRQLRQQVDMNLALRNHSAQMAAEIERLQARLADQGIRNKKNGPNTTDDL